MREKTPSEIIQSIFIQYKKELIFEVQKAETLLNMKRVSDSGKTLEIALKTLLTRLLPDYVGITRGIIFDSDCNTHSNEIDLILYDKRYFSGFVVDDWGKENLSYISIDTVLGILSVKKTLDLYALKDAIKNISSVYKLSKKSVENQFHYDLNFGDSILYKEGSELNKIFSCIIAFKNDLFYKKQKDKEIIKTDIGKQKYKKILRTDTEIQKYFDEKSSETWFDGMNTDIIYTLDGTIFFPMILDEGQNKWIKSFKIDKLGDKKNSLNPYIENDKINVDTRLILGYTYDFDKPEISLGQFIAYLQYYCGQLVKSSPDISKIFKNYLNRSIGTMVTKRRM
ncbi:DUF6602 domain-containing protein [Vallitalea guaymasensis]|uniref:DUF6602 domain-containing protein n=1 Tax=Vallitalea guaymasensis TaxID=1185412 RepID=UPI0023530D1C|nr:DUF6602 domain-containing protein [Vallitalea guaymasensis]